VVEDCGTVINPQLVDEQIRGGVVQGIGAALLGALRL
jgi:aerobic carbon-monoxide dehydrogenase large subunit